MFDEVRKVSEAFKDMGQEMGRILQPMWDWPAKEEMEDGMRKQNVTIDWTRLPDWARYVAMDANGRWWVYAEKPYVANDAWGNRGDHPAFRISEHLAPRGFTGDWHDSLFCRDGLEIQEQAPSPLEEIQDIVERQLWASVYVECFKQAIIASKLLNGTIDTTLGPDSFAQVSDEAVAEYRKRYGAER